MIDNSKTNGRWTKQEHQKFILGNDILISGLQLYGKDWKKIETLIGTRNGAQIRSHAQKFFIKIQKQNEPNLIHDVLENTKESPFDELGLNVQNSIQQNVLQQVETKADYSYFLNKIVQKNFEDKSFDFWENFVDTKNILESSKQQKYKRKNSFVSLSLDQNEGEYQTKPFKKIKSL